MPWPLVPPCRRSHQRGVESDQRGIDRGRAPRQDRDTAAGAVAPVAPRAAGTTDGLIANEGAIGQSQRTIVRGTVDDTRTDVDGAADSVAAIGPGASAPPMA